MSSITKVDAEIEFFNAYQRHACLLEEANSVTEHDCLDESTDCFENRRALVQQAFECLTYWANLLDQFQRDQLVE